MKKNLHVLILAYIYPPDAGSGTFRTLYFANNLVRDGADVTVVTVKKECFCPDAIVDDLLLESVDPSIEVFRASAQRPINLIYSLYSLLKSIFGIKNRGEDSNNDKIDTDIRSFLKLGSGIKDTITGLLSCPDQHIGWVPYAIMLGRRIIKEKKINCIYATGGPWSALLAGAILKKISRLPLVIDFRDPWCSNPNFARRPCLCKKIERKMESFCVYSADKIIANTEELRDDFLQRFPSIEVEDICAITNGFDELMDEKNSEDTKKFTLVHAGELYMSRNPEQMLLAIKDVVKNDLIPRDKLCVKFVGGISIDSLRIAELLESPDVNDVVEIIPRVTHREAIKLQVEASALILIQLNFPLQIPRKLYEYLSFRKPIIAITDKNGATWNIIRRDNLGTIVENDSNEIRRVLVKMYSQWLYGSFNPLRFEQLEPFSNKLLAKKMSSVLHKTI